MGRSRWVASTSLFNHHDTEHIDDSDVKDIRWRNVAYYLADMEHDLDNVVGLAYDCHRYWGIGILEKMNE
jgi:hypothetical protein